MDFIDLKKQYEIIGDKVNERVLDIMSGARFIMGKEVKELEGLLAEYTGRKYCISCSSGTDALTMSLMALNIGKGDAVFVPSFTFFSTAEVVSFLGATPIFVDVYEDAFNIDVAKLEEAIKHVKDNTNLKPKVIMPVDLFGQPADYDDIYKLAEKYGLIVVEDGAQGFGGAIGDRKACSFGQISATSFFPAKPLGCYGDGGAIFTDDDKIADALESIRIHGKGSDKYSNIRIGINGRLDTIQAAVLIEKLKVFDDETEKKNRVAQRYSELLDGFVVTPKVKRGYYSSWAQYSVLAKDDNERTRIIEALKQKNIPTAIYYINPLHTLDVFTNEDSYHTNCSVSEDLSKKIFSLPMHAYLTEKDILEITNCIKEAINTK